MKIETKEEKIKYNRQLVANIRNDIWNRDMGYCAYISCFECPLNIGKEEIVCLITFEILR